MIASMPSPPPRLARTLSCVMPAFNEAASLPRVVPQVLAALSTLVEQIELIVVNDGSRDDSVEILHRLGAQHAELVVLTLSRNFGKEAALTAGLRAARGDVVVLLDADGQHPTALVTDMLDKWRQGADVVYAVRRQRADQTRLHARLAASFYRLVNWGSRVQIPADAGDFRLMDRRVVDALAALPERNRFMKGLYAWVGFPTAAIDYEPLPREAGNTSFGLGGALRLGLTGLLAFSPTPLRLVGVAGLLLALLALGYGGWVVIEYFWLGIDVPGYATLVVSMMLLSGVQLMSIGVLAEYVARIYDEVKQRPLYLLADRQGRGLPPRTAAGEPQPSAAAP